MTASERELLEHYFRATADRDWDLLTSIRHKDWTEDWPQTGERIVGSENWRLVHENYPGYPEINNGEVTGADPTYIVSPMFTLVRLSGAGDAWVVEGLNHYPDGSIYNIVKLIEIRDGKVRGETTYFSPQSDPPEWRSQWVERLEPADRDRG
jgi:hypothetical protein